jgi:hypothetical protein
MRGEGESRPASPRVVVVLLLAVLAGLAGAGGASARPGVFFPPACQTVTFHSEPELYAQRACMNLGVRTHQVGRSYLFLTPNQTGVGIFGNDGTLVWWQRRPFGDSEEHNPTVVRLWGQRLLAVWVGNSHRIGSNHVFINDGSVLLYNNHYQQVGQITAGAPFQPDQLDMHEFRITPQGDALVGIYLPVKRLVPGGFEYVVHYVIQKLSLVREAQGIHTGRVLFQWSTQGHVPVSQSALPDPGAGTAWDFFHGNAITQDPDGNLVVSGRNTSGLYKINVRTGRIMWQLGARGDPTLKLPWCYQHDVTALGNGDYSLFDDGSIGPGCYPKTWHPARGLVIHVDDAHGRVRVSLVRAYTHRPSIYSEYTGSMQVLPGGDALVDWGVVPEVTQYRRSGRVLMDLSLSGQSYRGFRFAWTGVPSTPPAGAARLTSSGTEVWASWNGSTQLRAWRVLAGATSSTLAVAAARVSKAGFETSISLNKPYAAVEVQALSASGHVLSTSQPIVPVAGA